MGERTYTVPWAAVVAGYEESGLHVGSDRLEALDSAGEQLREEVALEWAEPGEYSVKLYRDVVLCSGLPEEACECGCSHVEGDKVLRGAREVTTIRVWVDAESDALEWEEVSDAD